MTDLSDETFDTAAAVVDAVRAELGRHGTVVTAVIVLATTIEDTGKEAIWSATDDETASWTALGMLEWAAARERAVAAGAEST